MEGEQSPSSEGQSSKRLPVEHPLGLNRLDSDQGARFLDIAAKRAPWLMDQIDVELSANRQGKPWRPAAIEVEQLVDSSNAEHRLCAASVMAEYLEANPDADYGIWGRLVSDADPDVAVPAGYFLLGALGRRDLDLVKLLPVLEAFERQEQARQLAPEAGEEA